MGPSRRTTERTAVGGGKQRPRYPLELITTTMLEAYDVVSGRLVAELHIPAYGVSFLDDSHFAVFSTNTEDLPQLEVWQFGLRR
jgi:hypothetical protein